MSILMLYFFLMSGKIDKNIIAKNIISFRKSLALSQKEFAEKAGLSLRSIAYYETGKHSVPLKNIIQIAKALNVSVAALLGQEEETKSVIENIDIRWLKKITEIKKLPEHDQKAIIKYINMLVEKNNLRAKKAS
jgi:transcriptional regulator with XRE-family HTH domain